MFLFILTEGFFADSHFLMVWIICTWCNYTYMHVSLSLCMYIYNMYIYIYIYIFIHTCISDFIFTCDAVQWMYKRIMYSGVRVKQIYHYVAGTEQKCVYITSQATYKPYLCEIDTANMNNTWVIHVFGLKIQGGWYDEAHWSNNSKPQDISIMRDQQGEGLQPKAMGKSYTCTPSSRLT